MCWEELSGSSTASYVFCQKAPESIVHLYSRCQSVSVRYNCAIFISFTPLILFIVLRIALLQLKVTKDKTENVRHAITRIREAVTRDNVKVCPPNLIDPQIVITTDFPLQVVALPECFNCPYGTKYFGEYSETIPDGFTSQELSKAARELGIFLIGGSIPEQDQDKLYNTCTVWGPEGNLIAKHRKMHLFDIDIPGGIRFKESEVLSAGNSFTTFQVDEHFKIGLGICYDIRFEEMARIYRDMGCNVLVYPGAFNMTTGPMHWELLQRGRAVDSQCFVATASPARDTTADYVAYGHSMVVDPWGKVVSSAADAETTVIAELGLFWDLCVVAKYHKVVLYFQI